MSFDIAWVYAAIVALLVSVVGYDELRVRQRRAGLRRLAAARGLSFAERRDELATQPLPYFQGGRDRSCRNVISGSWDGLTVTIFDYRHNVAIGAGVLGDRRAYRSLSCVLVESGLAGRQLDIAWRRQFDDSPATAGLVDVPSPSEEFARRWRVRASDRRFAATLLDGALLAWLSDGGPDVRFELAGRSLLVVSAPVSAEAVSALVTAAREFRTRIPDAAKELYPAR